ncbi:metallophosphoesterase [Pedobacter insulae]|uniref:Calcineurin-like phosphoesterase domain-containing protein n=1 Tax=Pedobacter insulae TaxID=414048 RepID=A0A1I2UZD4_9SPHI|nr:metallophosphoesterase [Pedobacter insulae]SFG81207.1 hypothetical protein SAMN04489864_102376 [Pedobacter insulae]
MKIFERIDQNMFWYGSHTHLSRKGLFVMLLLIAFSCKKNSQGLIKTDSESNLLAATAANETTAVDETFYIAVIPDTQYYTDPGGSHNGTMNMFTNQIDWILANRASLNIQYVAHVGDITDNGDKPGHFYEWQNADSQIKRLHNADLPYGLAVGNHDQWCNGDPGSGATNNGYGYYYSKTRFTGKTWYGGNFTTVGSDNNDNHWDKFTVFGQKYVVIYIEFNEPNNGFMPNGSGGCIEIAGQSPYSSTIESNVFAWADNVIQANLDAKVIIVSHSIVAPSGGINGTHGAKAGLATDNPQAPYTAQGNIISAFAQAHPTVFMMLSGHRTGEGYRRDVYSGHVVKTFLADYQGREVADVNGVDVPNNTATKGGDGFMRIMKFNKTAGTIEVRTIQPLPGPNVEETDKDSKFTVSMYN